MRGRDDAPTSPSAPAVAPAAAGGALRGRLRRTCARGIALAAVVGALAACTDGGITGGTPTESPTVPSAATSDGDSSNIVKPAPSTPLAIPTVELITAPPAATADGAATLSTEDLVRVLSEKLSGNASTTVQTVVCAEALPLQPGGTTDCTATLKDSTRSSQQVWHVYPTRNPDGTTAVLFLSGDTLSAEFAALLATEGTAAVTGSVGSTFGSSDAPAAEVQEDAQTVLTAGRSPVELGRCEGMLSFATFDPVSCSGTQAGAPVRAYVLPGTFVAAEPGLLVVTVPGG